MATMQGISSKRAEMSFGLNKMPVKKLPTKNIISKESVFAITDPIDPKRVSKEPTGYLNANSIVKAGFIFSVAVGFCYLTKATKIFSYFGWGEKNSKDLNGSEITKKNFRKNDLTVRRNLETKIQTNNPTMNHFLRTNRGKDRTVKFEEKKIEEFKNLPSKNGNINLRRSVLNPTFKGSYDTPGSARGVFVYGNYAYVADGVSLQIIEVTDPSNPTFKGSYDTPDIANEVFVSGNYAYVADWESGLQIIDIKDPSTPTFKGAYDVHHYPRLALDVAIFNNYAYLADGGPLRIIDVSDPSNPALKVECYSTSIAREVVISGNYAYLASFTSGLQIIDINDPLNPTFAGSCDIFGNAWGIDVSGNYAYLVGGVSGLQIIDVSNPSNSTLRGRYITPGEALGVTVFGNYAYVVDDDTSLQIIDIKDPSNPTFKASYEMPGARRIAISGNYAYVAAGESGLQIIALGPEMDSDLIVLAAWIMVGGCIVCSVICPLSLGFGLKIFDRYRNKILENESNTGVKKESEIKELENISDS
jgi:hypothetical protein